MVGLGVKFWLESLLHLLYFSMLFLCSTKHTAGSRQGLDVPNMLDFCRNLKNWINTAFKNHMQESVIVVHLNFSFNQTMAQLNRNSIYIFIYFWAKITKQQWKWSENLLQVKTQVKTADWCQSRTYYFSMHLYQ